MSSSPPVVSVRAARCTASTRPTRCSGLGTWATSVGRGGVSDVEWLKPARSRRYRWLRRRSTLRIATASSASPWTRIACWPRRFGCSSTVAASPSPTSSSGGRCAHPRAYSTMRLAHVRVIWGPRGGRLAHYAGDRGIEDAAIEVTSVYEGSTSNSLVGAIALPDGATIAAATRHEAASLNPKRPDKWAQGLTEDVGPPLGRVDRATPEGPGGSGSVDVLGRGECLVGKLGNRAVSVHTIPARRSTSSSRSTTTRSSASILSRA